MDWYGEEGQALITELEEAGFEKTMTFEEWEDYNANVIAGRYGDSDVVVQYILARGDVVVTIEQNTQDRFSAGVPVTFRYPDVALVAHDAVSVACDMNTRLILEMVDEVGGTVPNRLNPTLRRGGPNAETANPAKE